jgi:hypothetical protein
VLPCSFPVPPRSDLIPTICDQPRQRNECVGDFPLFNVLVVAFAGFIVETEDANLVDDKRQAVFE